MAESVVSSVAEKIGNLLIDEAKFLRGVEGKVEDLQRELRVVQRLLGYAVSRRERNQAVEECVAQLRDLAYDAEDVIEGYFLKAALEEGQNIIKAYASFMAKCSCTQVHEVGTEIEGLKSRISHIGRRMHNYGMQSGKEGEHEQARALMPKRTYDHSQEDFVGREESIEVLVKELLSIDKKQRVISIWGIGGVGKTSLAKKVIAHDEVMCSFDDLAWACVSQEYHPKDILVGILVNLIPDQRERVMQMMADELSKTLYEIQQEKRCIVVLDDIWTKEAWDSLQPAFPIKDTRSKLLITTRNREVAEYIDRQGFLHELGCLSDGESWDLLKKRVFLEMKRSFVISSDGPRVGQNIVMCQAVEGIAKQLETEGQLLVITEDMKNLAKELLKKCAGLPLAVIVLGGLLAVNEWKTVYENINLHFSGKLGGFLAVDEWKTANEKIDLHFSDKSDVSKVLALSYDSLPWHLKPCFLCLGCFPKDVEIPAAKVFHMWIAEGFVSLNAHEREKEIPVEDVAEQYLMELVNRGMVQVQFKLSGKIKSCHVHDLMRDLCISKALQESFLSRIIQQDNEVDNCSALMAIKVKSSCKIRRLSLDRNVIPSLEARVRTLVHLRTLMSFEEDVEGDLKQFQSIFNHCKFLRVMMLENLSRMIANFSKSVGDLVHLRFLSLKGVDILDLPQSMGNLVFMEFLDLLTSRYVRVSMPNVLWKMRRLRYLRLPYDFDVKEKFHEARKKLRLGTLKNLQTLKNFRPRKCDVKDVRKLTNLKILSVFNQHDPVELEIFLQLAEFKHPQSLSFYFGNFDCHWTKDKLSEMSNCGHSCKLSLTGKIEKLPEHKSIPQQLRKLVLLQSQLEEDPMPILEKLPHLVVLMLGSHAFIGKEMVCSAGGFPQLKQLLFFGLHNLEEWRAAKGAVPHLSRLGFRYCDRLRVLPSHVSIYDCFYEINKEINKQSF